MIFSNKDFVHWHCHSFYSQFDGLCSPQDIALQARKMGFPALALTDHGSVMGWIKFVQHCRTTQDKKGEDIPHPPIKPILGCLLKGQPIITIDGIKSVENIKVGDMVLTHKGRFRKVNRIMKRKYNGKLFKIILSNRAQKELSLTEEHPILIRDRYGHIDWEKPGEIQFGRINKKLGIDRWNSWVCLPKLEQIDNVCINVSEYLPDNLECKNGYVRKFKKITKYESFIEWKNIPSCIVIDEELAYFLGLYVAEGSVNRKNNKINGFVTFTFNKNEDSYANFVVKLLKKRFDINARDRIRKDKGTRDIYFCCLPLAYILANLCGIKAKNKKIPCLIYSLNRNIKESFLDGILDGDGKSFETISNRIIKSRYLKVSSKNLIWGFRQLIADLGFWGQISEIISKKGEKIYTSYGVSFYPFRSYARTIEDEEYVYKPIFNIINNLVENIDVYNFEVEEDNSYVSDFILHNCEFYLSRRMDIGQYDKKRDTDKIKKLQPDGRKGNRHLNLYAMNYNGYKNICYMSQKSFTDGFYYDSRIDIDLLASHSNGVMCGSACLSSIINVNLIYGHYERAKKICSIFKDIFNDNFFLEVMYHGIREEKEAIPLIFKLSTELNIPIICTNDSHYIMKDEGHAQEILMCISQQRCIKDPKRLKFSHMEFYLKSAEEMGKIFGKVPSCLTNSLIMAERIDTKDIEKNLFIGMRLPKFNIPSEYKDVYDYLSKLAWDGMKRNGWEKSEEHVKRLKMELQDVLVARESNNYDFSTYFLIVRDYIEKAKEEGILVGCGRGSGYSSVLLRCLDITYGADPIKYGLLWQRFLGFSSEKFIKSSDFGFKNISNSLSNKKLDKRE